MHVPEMSTITPQLLLRAYTAGIFPMAESAQDNALYWVEPELRGIIPLDGFHVPRRLARLIRQRVFHVTVDQSFDEVIAGCAGAPGSAGASAVVERPSTWINARISALYSQLHKMGVSGSIRERCSNAEFRSSSSSRSNSPLTQRVVHHPAGGPFRPVGVGSVDQTGAVKQPDTIQSLQHGRRP